MRNGCNFVKLSVVCKSVKFNFCRKFPSLGGSGCNRFFIVIGVILAGIVLGVHECARVFCVYECARMSCSWEVCNLKCLGATDFLTK